MADAKKALSVSMYCHAEQPRILHSLNLANVAVGKVGDYREFLVKKPGQNVTTEIAHDGESIVNPSEISFSKCWRFLRLSAFDKVDVLKVHVAGIFLWINYLDFIKISCGWRF